MNNGPRYQARKRWHSTFIHIAQVLDTTQLDAWSNHLEVAECPDLETAQKVALALNRTAE